MRITDRRVDACIHRKVTGLEKFLQERSLIVDGQLQRLRRLHQKDLWGLLASRGKLLGKSTRFDTLIQTMDDYLKMCKANLAANKAQLKAILQTM